jgi:predicted regulator of Ras-like GTPase activity (Roadblock/LC7/MglB family)
MVSSLREILGQMTGVPCIVAAVLLKPDGSMIEQSMTAGVDLETVQTIARDMMPAWESVGRDVEIGKPRMLVLERGSGPLSIMPIGRDTLLAAIGNPSCSLGQLHRQMTRARDALDEAAPIAAGADGTDGAARTVDPASDVPLTRAKDVLDEAALIDAAADGTDGAAPAVEPAPDLQPVPGRMGEVVVIGAITFRVALRLVATLARATGVRSASLKTFAPGGIAIDVVIEGDGALASITASSIGDCSLTVIERTDARLVLGTPAPGEPADRRVP